jgi:hypothetical protein
MRRQAETGFLVAGADIRNDIYVPRYYDPRIAAELQAISDTHDLLLLGDLIAAGNIEHRHGSYVPKMHYGTGPFPYIRTSDISNWELRASPKHGVSEDVFFAYSTDQDVRSGDIIFVHEGTYLIGTVAMVTAYDGPMLYQHHLAKFRVNDNAPFTNHFLLAAFGSPIVQRQIRARQFSADIIDSVVGRIGEIIIPVPKDRKIHDNVSNIVRRAVDGRGRWRERVSHFLPALEQMMAVGTERFDEVVEWVPRPNEYDGITTFLGDREQFTAFCKPSNDMIGDILIPKYYNPKLRDKLAEFEDECELRTVDVLIQEKILSLDVGDEIGRLAYGTGTIPFMRTSDLGTFELKADAKHGVDEMVWAQYQRTQDVQSGDVLLVRDGTYLVGSSSLVLENDLPLLFCGGLYKLRCNDSDALQPGLLYALLNLPIARRQMRSKQFTRDVIDTLGHRIREVVLPIPRSLELRGKIASFVEEACQSRVRLRATLRDLCAGLFSLPDSELGVSA